MCLFVGKVVYPFFRLLFFRRIRHGVVHHHSVQKLDYTRGILLRKSGIVRYHYYQLFARDFLYKLHNLHGSGRIQRARGFVRKQNFGLVDQSAGNGHPLALSARQLVGLFVVLSLESHAVQRFSGALGALLTAHARDGKGKLHVSEHRLVRDKIVTLEDKAHAVIAVHVPVAVAEAFGADSVDADVARSVFVQSPDDIEKRGLAAPRRPQNGNELVFPEG